MTYLVDKYDTDRRISYAPGTPEHVEQTSWLMFQMGGLGPMQGTWDGVFRACISYFSDIAQAKRIISASLLTPAPTMLLSGILMRRSVSIRFLNRGFRRVLTLRGRSILLLILRLSLGSVELRSPWRLICLSGLR